MADKSPRTDEVMGPLLETMSATTSEEEALLSFYRTSLNADDWSAEIGVRLLADIRSTPRNEWNSVPQFAILGRLALTVVSLYLWKLEAPGDHELAWQMLKASDTALRDTLAGYDCDDGAQLTSALSWPIREAVKQVLFESRR